MGTEESSSARQSARGASIADALFSKVQQRVLGVLFGDSNRSYYANEIIALAGSGTGAVQRELARLESAGLVTVTRVGRQKHYRANAGAPVHAELRALILKTVALGDVLRGALAPLADRVRAAFVFGSIAKGEATTRSDIDLLVVADDLEYADVFAAFEEAAERLGRKINPTIYTHAELTRRIRRGNSFVVRVLSQEKIWLIGTERDLAT